MELTAALDAVPTGERERIDHNTGRLVGSRCRTCDTTSWPARAVCHHCGSADTERRELSLEGQLITHTTVWVARGALQAPFTLGQVELPEGLLIFCHVRGLEPEHVVPLPVSMVVDVDPAAIPPFWFEPVSA